VKTNKGSRKRRKTPENTKDTELCSKEQTSDPVCEKKMDEQENSRENSKRKISAFIIIFEKICEKL
jgi:hypothetical protein